MLQTVLYFTESDDFGGAEQVLLTILSMLDRQRWRPILFHHRNPGIAPLVERVRGLDVKVQALPQMQGKKGYLQIPQIVRKIRFEQPRIFHANLNHPLACRYGLIAATLARVPAVIATEQLFVDTSRHRTILLKRLLSPGVDRYIAVSHDMAQRLRQTFRLPIRKIQIVHNGIPLAPFDHEANKALRATLTGATDRPIILTTARLDKQKGLCYLLEAACLVPDALFVLAGDGPERARLEAQVQVLGINDRVIFLGYRNDIPDLLASCDLFVLPSLFEGLPLSVLEAMAANKPVIATAIGGTDEAIVHGISGLLVPPGNPGALATAIRRVLSDPTFAQRMGLAGKVRVQQKFSAEKMVQRITEIYDHVLAPHEVGHDRYK